jgi:hypothetical protein
LIGLPSSGVFIALASFFANSAGLRTAAAFQTCFALPAGFAMPCFA